MPRAVWTGGISFGLVNIPVRLYPATESRDPRFHLVDRVTGRRVRYRRVVEEPPPPTEDQASIATGDEPDEAPDSSDRAVSPSISQPPSTAVPGTTDRVVPYGEIARGYDVGGGEQVVVEREDLEALRPEPSRTIEIEHFVALDDVDPVYFEKSYQVAPADEISERPYALLRVAMERSRRVAVGRFVLRSREHLVLIRPTSGILGLETLYFSDEVRQTSARWLGTVASVEAVLSDDEIRLAERLIAALEAEWEPSQYQDPYRERVADLIQSRAPQEQPAEVESAPTPSVVDLMAALKASVDAVGSEGGPREGPVGRAPADRLTGPAAVRRVPG